MKKLCLIFILLFIGALLKNESHLVKAESPNQVNILIYKIDTSEYQMFGGLGKGAASHILTEFTDNLKTLGDEISCLTIDGADDIIRKSNSIPNKDNRIPNVNIPLPRDSIERIMKKTYHIRIDIRIVGNNGFGGTLYIEGVNWLNGKTYKQIRKFMCKESNCRSEKYWTSIVQDMIKNIFVSYGGLEAIRDKVLKKKGIFPCGAEPVKIMFPECIDSQCIKGITLKIMKGKKEKQTFPIINQSINIPLKFQERKLRIRIANSEGKTMRCYRNHKMTLDMSSSIDVINFDIKRRIEYEKYILPIELTTFGIIGGIIGFTKKNNSIVEFENYKEIRNESLFILRYDKTRYLVLKEARKKRVSSRIYLSASGILISSGIILYLRNSKGKCNCNNRERITKTITPFYNYSLNTHQLGFNLNF